MPRSNRPVRDHQESFAAAERPLTPRMRSPQARSLHPETIYRGHLGAAEYEHAARGGKPGMRYVTARGLRPAAAENFDLEEIGRPGGSCPAVAHTATALCKGARRIHPKRSRRCTDRRTGCCSRLGRPRAGMTPPRAVRVNIDCFANAYPAASAKIERLNLSRRAGLPDRRTVGQRGREGGEKRRGGGGGGESGGGRWL